tara:strand:+ start:98 stop:538 length:441 start_codon:yes stop_codon:yes gene_type:complete
MIYIVKSLFNKDITDGLHNGCVTAMNEKGINKSMQIKEVPGAFDIPGAVSRIIKKDKAELIITLGCVIKGDTDHYHYICDAVSNGIMKLTIESEIPILFGVLTCQNKELALIRAGKTMDKNKGYELGIMAYNLLSERNNNGGYTKS